MMVRPTGPRLLELALAGALALALAAGPAAADDSISKADELFAEGVKLRDSNLELACAKFDQSLQLNPQAIGVLLNVAMCDEKHGRVASAVKRYRETRARALEQSFPEYLKAADAKLAALTPQVPYLTIRFERPPGPQTKIVIDDQAVPLSGLREVPLDPGERTVIVSAPGRITFTRKISLAPSERRELAVPALAKPSPRRTIGKITLVSGAAAAATGVVLGYVAHRRYEDYKNRTDENGDAYCHEDNGHLLCKDGDVLAGARSARQLGTVGTIVGAVGVAAILTGGYLWVFAPRTYADREGQGGNGAEARGRRGVSVVPQLSPGGGGLAVFGRF
jgi:hypothetical protein